MPRARTTVGELIEVIRHLDLLICVNSSAAAIADAVGTPSLVLLGPEDGRLTATQPGSRRAVLQPGGSRAPGSWCELGRWGVLSGCESPVCRGVGGLQELDAGEVERAADRLLDDTFGLARENCRGDLIGDSSMPKVIGMARV